MFPRLLQLVRYFHLDYLEWSQTSANIVLQEIYYYYRKYYIPLTILVEEENNLLFKLNACVLNNNLL